MVLKAIAVILVIVAVAVAAVYLMGQFEQTKPFHDQIMGYVNTAKTWITENWMIVSGSIGSVVTVGGLAWSKISSAKNELSQVKDEASSKINGLTGETEQLKEKLSGYEAQAKTTAEGYEAQIADLQKKLEDSTVDVKAVTDLKAQLQGAQNMHSNFVAQLTSGAQTVIDPMTNQTYKLITLEKTVVK